jgi:hypothetical protein
VVVVEEPAIEVVVAECGLNRVEVHPDQYAPGGVPLPPPFLGSIFGINGLQEGCGCKILISGI